MHLAMTGHCLHKFRWSKGKYLVMNKRINYLKIYENKVEIYQKEVE